MFLLSARSHQTEVHCITKRDKDISMAISSFTCHCAIIVAVDIDGLLINKIESELCWKLTLHAFGRHISNDFPVCYWITGASVSIQKPARFLDVTPINAVTHRIIGTRLLALLFALCHGGINAAYCLNIFPFWFPAVRQTIICSKSKRKVKELVTFDNLVPEV